jgi:purine nucleoside phosphorylase
MLSPKKPSIFQVQKVFLCFDCAEDALTNQMTHDEIIEKIKHNVSKIKQVIEIYENLTFTE